MSDKAPTCPQCGHPIAAAYTAPAPQPAVAPPAVQQVHTHSTTQEVGSFEKGFGTAAGMGCGYLAVFGLLAVGTVILIMMAAKD